MKLLELPNEVLRLILWCVVRGLGLTASMHVRLTCRVFAHEILDAVVRTRVLEDVARDWWQFYRVAHQPHIIAQYIHHRVCTDAVATHPWISTIRETCRMLAEQDSAGNSAEVWEKHACACLATNASSHAMGVLAGDSQNERTGCEGGRQENCLTVAAWVGDLALVQALHTGTDPVSLFGRPSWAGAAQGHMSIVRFCLENGAKCHDPDFQVGPVFNLATCPLGAAAYMGHEDVVRLYLQDGYYNTDLHYDERTAATYAVLGEQTATLELLLDHMKSILTTDEYLAQLDSTLVLASRHGATMSARVLLARGAHVDESDDNPYTCLQLAALAGSRPMVEMLLDAGARTVAPWGVVERTSTERKMRRAKPDALTLAQQRGHTDIVRLLEEKQRQKKQREGEEEEEEEDGQLWDYPRWVFRMRQRQS